jgi:hypothetical protein
MLLPEFDPKNDIRRWSRCAWGPPRYYYAGDTRRGITAWSWRVPTKRTTCERRYETGRTTIRLAPRLYKMDCKWNATGKNENRKWNWKQNWKQNWKWNDKQKMNPDPINWKWIDWRHKQTELFRNERPEKGYGRVGASRRHMPCVVLLVPDLRTAILLSREHK